MTSTAEVIEEGVTGTGSAVASTSHSSSGSEECHINLEQQLATPPKIPPPPSEHPPPYTPFGGQTSAPLLSQSNSTSIPIRGTNINTRYTRSINPPGLRKYFQYLTARNALIALIALIVIIIFGYIIHRSNISDEELHMKTILEGTKPLDSSWLALGQIETWQKLTFDEYRDSLLLSNFSNLHHQLKSYRITIKDHLSGFIHFEEKTFVEKNEDCIRFTVDVICCRSSIKSKHHKTECVLEYKNETIRSEATKYDFVPIWQSLLDGNKLVFIYNKQRHSILDLITKRIYMIEENRMPHGYHSAGFFFPMDTAQQLDELVKIDDEFRICEYLKADSGDYMLKDAFCKLTRFRVEKHLPTVKFCSNSLYTAVIQYHTKSDSDGVYLTWHLRVSFDSSPDIYSAADRLEASPLPEENFSEGELHEITQLVIDCNDEDVDIFVMGKHELQQYNIQLPKDLHSEHM